MLGENLTDEVSRSNETPFRVLQESLSNARQVEGLKRNYNYLGDDSYRADNGLHLKYGSDEFTKVFEHCHIRQSPTKSVGKEKPTYRYLDMAEGVPQQGKHNYLNAGHQNTYHDYRTIEPVPRQFGRPSPSPSPQPVQSFHDYKFTRCKSTTTFGGAGTRRPRNYLQEEQGGWERDIYAKLGGGQRKFNYLCEGTTQVGMRW